MTPRRIAITGANGLVGSHLCEHFAARGWEVSALVRAPERASFAGEGIRAFRCVLPDDVGAEGLVGASVLVHCAWATRGGRRAMARAVDEEGTRRLLAAARAARVERFVFVSSLAARPDAHSYYGRSKFAVEALLDPARDLVLRPGLVLAARGGGLFGRLQDSVARAGLVPAFGGGRQLVRTVHVDDLCTSLERALAEGSTGVLTVAEPRGIEYRELLRGIAARLGRRCLLVPLPFAPVLWTLRLLEALRLPLPVTSENLLGLRAMGTTPSAAEDPSRAPPVRSADESLDALLGPARATVRR